MFLFFWDTVCLCRPERPNDVRLNDITNSEASLLVVSLHPELQDNVKRPGNKFSTSPEASADTLSPVENSPLRLPAHRAYRRPHFAPGFPQRRRGVQKGPPPPAAVCKITSVLIGSGAAHISILFPPKISLKTVFLSCILGLN